MFAKFLSVLSFYLLIVTPWAAAEAVTVDLNEIEANIEQAMKAFEVPGVAVAIVKDDKVVMKKGFGVKQLSKPNPFNGNRRRARGNEVDEYTLFGIASNTKAFTAAALAILVDEGKLDWDDKVQDHLPGFKLNDPYATRELTIRDMLSHRSGLGLGAGDLMIWPTTDISNDEILKRIQFLEPASSFRSKYAYNNIMYVMAGEVIEQVSGQSWGAFVRARILKPLGMMETRMKFSAIGKDNTNVAKPHAHVKGKLQVVGGNFLQNFASAGSMASNVNDMSQWLRMQLRGGLIAASADQEAYPLFSGDQQQQMWQPNIMRDVSYFDKTEHKTHFRGYGLGWGLRDYHGYQMVSHTGGILGMVSIVVMLPELNLGVVVLTNQQAGGAFMAISTDIINRYIGVKSKDWVEVYQSRSEKRRAKAEKKANETLAAADSDSKPSLALKNYAKIYRDNWYGDIEISIKDGSKKSDGLEIQFSRTKALIGKLEHFQHNTFIIRWYDRSLDADAFINFQINRKGEVAQATIEPVSKVTDFSFDFKDLLLKPKF